MNVLAQALALLGIISMALMVSGLRPVYLIPCYGVLALAGVLGWSPKRHLGLSARVVPCLVAATVFFGYILCRIVFSPVEYIARPDLFMVLGGLIIYLVTALCATSPVSRIVFTTMFLVLACAQVFVGAIQFSKGNNFSPFDFLPRSDYGARASGFYGCPNHLAGFLEVVLFMSLSLAFWSRWRLIGKMLAGYVAVVCVVGILMSGSRGGYLSAATGLFTFAVLSLRLARPWLRRDVWLFLITTLVFAMIGIGYVFISALQSSDLLAFRVESATGDAPLRLSLWRAAIRQFELNPLFGTGSATYLYYGRQFREANVQSDPVYVHGDYLQLLAEFGLIGIAGLGFFVFTHLRSGWKFLANVIAGGTEHEEREVPGFYGDNTLALTTGALSSVAAYAVHSIGDFNLHIPANTLVMAFIFGLLANPVTALRPAPKSGSGAAQKFLRYFPLALPALGLWLAFAPLPTWTAENFAAKSKALLSDWQSLEDPNVARRAADLAAQGIQRDPNNPSLYSCLGDSAAALADMADEPAAKEESYQRAIEAFRGGLRVAPQDVTLVLSLAGIFDEMKRFDESEPLYKRAFELDPNSGQVLLSYGAHFHLRGNFDEAEAYYRKAGELGRGPAAGLNIRRLQEDRKAAPTAR